MFTYFKSIDLSILACSLIFIISSFILFRKDKYTASIILLTLGAFAARLFVAHLDHFLHIWDESIHALVAKNMMEHPFTPMLYVHDLFPTNDNQYIGAHIWMHKPPLFLWLMAISMKIFGVNLIGVRMPSVILSSFITPIIYRIGKLTVNERVGFYSAFLFALSCYFLKVASGYINTDHNDAVFIFFVSASFWAWIEYYYSGNKKWIYVIGILSGMAVLVKWLTGLLVYFCWGLTILFDKEKKESFLSYKNIFISALIAAIVFVPWQIYILLKFTQQALFAYSTYSKHFSEPLEDHAGTSFFHIDLLGEQYGWIVPFILVLSFYLLYRKLQGNTKAVIILISWILTPYLLFAVAKTKMPLMVLITCPVVFLSLGNLFSEIADFVLLKFKEVTATVVLVVMFLIIGFFNLNIHLLESEHTDMPGDGRFNFMQNTYLADQFKKVDKQLPGKDYHIFNCCCYLTTPLMFYSGMTAYGQIPDKDLVKDLESKGIKLAILPGGTLPDYIINDPQIIKIKFDQAPN